MMVEIWLVSLVLSGITLILGECLAPGILREIPPVGVALIAIVVVAIGPVAALVDGPPRRRRK